MAPPLATGDGLTDAVGDGWQAAASTLAQAIAITGRHEIGLIGPTVQMTSSQIGVEMAKSVCDYSGPNPRTRRRSMLALPNLWTPSSALLAGSAPPWLAA